MQSQKTLKSWTNTIQAAMKPFMAKVMIGKVVRRFSDEAGDVNGEQNRAWLAAQAIPMEKFMENFGPDVAAETAAFCADLKAHAAKVLSDIPFDLGGGAGIPLLYALVRHRKPAVVVETGVAAGFSSASILAAMDKNGQGKLYSSDFPYFRIPNPVKYVGVVVPQNLKARWDLHVKGDENNLPAIAAKTDAAVDIFHYDSDKSYKGRTFAMSVIGPKMAASGIIVMDDIQDNAYFHDIVTRGVSKPWCVLAYEGKYIGVIGQIS